ncbi:MAG TPA: TetR/AcrR family transcriptional regulator [Solirubrobacteraceae bacterium]
MSTVLARDQTEAGAVPAGGAREPASRRAQRERILLAMADIASAEGYAGATITKLIAHAGISRPTFYEHFDSKDLCFLAVEGEIAAELLEQVRVAVAQGAPSRAAECTVRCIVEFARRSPERARLLLCESLAAEPAAMDERDRAVDAIAGSIERTQARCAPQTILADLPSSALVGAVFRVIAQRLRHCAGDLQETAGELIDWIRRYERPLVEHRWRTLDPSPPPPPSRVVSDLPSQPPPLPRDQRGMSRQKVVRNQRERILYATALVASRSGYNATNVTEILVEAGVDKRAFYSAFANKQAAFMAAHELGFQHTMTVIARAFVSASTWPERVWEGILAGTQFQAKHPLLAHLLNVQSHAVDRHGLEPMDQTYPAFTLLQHEGNQLADEPLGETAMQATLAASLEVTFQCSREGRGEQISLMAPMIAFLCLAPYVGPGTTEELIQTKMAAGVAQ